MNNINITVALCEEDRARLDKIYAALQGREYTESVKKAQEPESQATTQAEPKAAPVVEIEPHEAKKEAPAKPEPKQAPAVSLEQLQGLVVKLATNGKKLEARDLVFEYAKSVTDVPAEKRGELYAKLQKLEA